MEMQYSVNMRNLKAEISPTIPFGKKTVLELYVHSTTTTPP